MASRRDARRGLVHRYVPNHWLTAFEHTPTPASEEAQNLLILVGGLFDGLQTVHYADSISDALPENWSLAQAHLSSSYAGWGISSLIKDATELAKCVSYFKNFKAGKIVLIGHSTGCQDVMEYLTGPGHEGRPVIDGGIIQAPASDREAFGMVMDPDVLRRSNAVAQKMVDSGDADEILPRNATDSFTKTPVTARRWLSLTSPNHDGADDYFSSDLEDEQLMRSFGALPATTPICVLVSGEDEYMPPAVDKSALVNRWASIAKRGVGRIDEEHSCVIRGASHSLRGNPEEVVSMLVQKVVGFLNSL